MDAASAASNSPARSDQPIVLLDATERLRRRAQMGFTFLGVIVLLVAKGAFRHQGEGLSPLGLALLAIGLALLGFSLMIKIRWRVEYEGHEILFENHPLRGEALYLDGVLQGRGKRGVKNELRGRIEAGDAAGRTIVASSEARLFEFRCRITAEPAPAGGP